MASGFTVGLGSLTSRFIGLVALIPVGVMVLRYVDQAQAGALDTDAMKMLAQLAIITFCVLVAVIFLFPPQTRRSLRMRQHPLARIAHALILLAIVALMFLVAGALLGNYTVDNGIGAIVILLLGIPTVFLVFLLFVLPGAYAMHLAREFHGPEPEVRLMPGNGGVARTTRTAKRSVDTDDHFIPELATPEQIQARMPNGPAEGYPASQKASRPTQQRRWVKPQKQNQWRITWSVPFAMIPFAMMFIGLIGASHAHFIPTNAQIVWAEQVVIPVCIAAGLIAGVASAFDRNAASKVRSPILRLILLAAICAGVAFVFGKSFLTTGAPVIHSQFNKDTPAQLLVTVTGIGPKRKRRSCDYVVYAETSAPYNGQEIRICDVPPSIWESTAPGQRLRLEGFETPYGFRYSEIRR